MGEKMKPWEGKRFKEAYDLFLDNFVANSNEESRIYLGAYKMLEWALKKDWEEKMDSLTPQGRALLDMIMTKGKR